MCSIPPQSQKDFNLTNTSMVANVQEFLWHSICHLNIGLKNDYGPNGVIRGPYLSRGDKGHALWKIVRTPSKIRSLNLTLYWNLAFFSFFGHLSVIDRIFLVMTDFFFRSQ